MSSASGSKPSSPLRNSEHGIRKTEHATRETQEASHVTDPLSPLLVTSIAALLQRTFHPDTVRQRTRTLARGERIVPLDLVERLEEQGYEPEAQVTQKGE